jgi:hypothetical protein
LPARTLKTTLAQTEQLVDETPGSRHQKGLTSVVQFFWQILLIRKQYYICGYLTSNLTAKQIIVAYDNNDKRMESVYSKRIRAGKRRTYFFDVRATRSNDYYLTITESRKKFNEDGYDRHKIFLYKEDFNKFLKALTEAVDYVKTDLMPDFDFDAYNHDNDGENTGGSYQEGNVADEVVEEEVREVREVRHTPAAPSTPTATTGEEVDKW